MRTKSTKRPGRLCLGLLAACLLLLPLQTLASSAPEDEKMPAVKTGMEKMPPLIEREIFFEDPEIAGAQISPDGQWITFLKPYRDVLNVWVKKREEAFGAARPITADTTRPVTGYFWTQDSRYVLYVQDKGGDENYHVYAVDPKAEAEESTGVPPARDLTPLEGVRAMIYAAPEKTPGKILVGLNDRDAAAHDVYRVDIATGERELLVTNDSNVAQWSVDLEGRVRLSWRQTEDGGSEIQRVEDGKPGTAIYSCNFEETCVPYRFHKDGRRVYMISDKGDDVDLSRLLLLDVETGKTELVDKDPEGEVDFGGAIFSDKTEELIGTAYVGDRVRIYPRTKQFERDLEFLREELPDGELGLGSQSQDDRLAIVSVSSDVNPGSAWLYDRKDRKVEKLYDSRPELPTKHLARVKPVRYKARDGLKIPAYLTLPKGVAPKKLPAVILPHGGPWARDNWGYDPFAQFLANRGYAVLQPNFRGSTGYGKSFLNAGNGEWGTGAMQHDLTDGVKYLVEKGIADPERVSIMGGSYGGYATLAGVAFTPELYAAGVSIVGPSNIITLMESIPPYWKPIRRIFEKRVGNMDDPEDRERLIAQSPLFSAKNISAPLLVIQGANDPRVKKAESDQIVVALRELERPVEYLVAPDEGHGFAGEENRLAMFAVIEGFLATHLGGRYQQESPADVASRIADLRVDIASVELPKAIAGADEARTAALARPLPDALAPATLHYASKIALPGGQEIDLESTRVLAQETVEQDAVWRIETNAQTPMGAASDVYYLRSDSLQPLSRKASQGPVSIDLDYSPEAVTGSIKSPMGDMAINERLDAPVFGDEAALEATLVSLPLEEGFKTTYRTFDVQTQKVRLWSFEVTGTETAEVPAGSFTAFKAQIIPLDDAGGGGTLWISQDVPRRVVRSEYSLQTPMGSASVTTTLTGVSTD